MRFGRAWGSLVLGLAVGVSLAACSAVPDATPSAPATASATDTPAPSATAAPAPALQPGKDAAANLDYFDTVATKVVAGDENAGGRAFVDALVAAGFDKAEMEVTFDETNIDLAADSIQFSVRFNGECLIGQNGPATDGYHSTVTAILASGTCLVGATRQIDW
ncbi:hypothetical protein E3T28_09670 [Cryobacterium sinapicolor]|uniref:DUF6993 domain-containing protein n=1 Tax=Cryobacterium sinapicolor TaxID=1259236 RepID=A0ABY2J273_9MICO|nr:hypothetical protein E3O67_13230 [Cryobacterium sp. TMT3-29-2]TFC99038.1 hypothetical protein E3T28_09670 [Cryobacterium sinapicolor]